MWHGFGASLLVAVTAVDGGALAPRQAPSDTGNTMVFARAEQSTSLAKVITINRERLSEQTIQMLERTYRTRLLSGNFWYDPASGLWGVWGGPAFGQILPGLKLGGPLTFDASGGQTNVVLNGRAIHPLEYRATIARYGYALPGRYWLDARGNIGLEGGPFLFNVYASAMGQGGSSWYRAGPGGYMASDGKCIGYTAPGGESFLAGC
jgi:hypothetical protein